MASVQEQLKARREAFKKSTIERRANARKMNLKSKWNDAKGDVQKIVSQAQGGPVRTGNVDARFNADAIKRRVAKAPSSTAKGSSNAWTNSRAAIPNPGSGSLQNATGFKSASPEQVAKFRQTSQGLGDRVRLLAAARNSSSKKVV